MSAFIRDNFRIFNVKQFIDSFFSGSSGNTLYLGIGRPYKWNDGDVLPSSNNTFRNLASELEDREDLMSIKKINSSSVSHSIKKLKWTPNQAYDEYRHDYGQAVTSSVYNGAQVRTLSEAYYYVVCDDNSVWICIRRPRVWTSLTTSSVVASTKSPIDPTTTLFTGSVATANLYLAADGYIWKKIAVTDSAEVVNFSSNDFHPVRTLKTEIVTGTYADQWTMQEQSKIHRGGIYSVTVTNQGAGYSSGNTVTVEINNAEAGTIASDGSGTSYVKISGDGTGLKYRVVVVGGNVRDIEVIDPGHGYTFANVTFVMTGSPNAPASAIPILTSPEGLGVNPVKDLNAYYLSLYASFSGSELGTFTTQNDYRKLVLIANPTITSSWDSIYSDAHADCMYRLQLDITPTINQTDKTITLNTGVKLKVVDFNDNAGVKILRCLRCKEAYLNAGTYNFQNASLIPIVGNTFVDDNTTTVAITAVDAAYPKINLGSGELLYSEYRQSVSRGEGITEQWKIVLEF